MKCSVSEEELALYAGNDLSLQESAVVAAHLTTCTFCRDMLEDLQYSRQLMAGSLIAPDSEDLGSVRNTVMRRLHSERKQSRFLRTAAIAAGVALITAPILLRNEADHRPQATGMNLQSWPLLPMPAFQSLDVMAAGPVYHRRHEQKSDAGLRALALSRRPDGGSELKISTADPNVTILLLMNGNNHEN